MGKRTGLVLFLSLISLIVCAGGFRDGIYRAYITRDMDAWEKLLKDSPVIMITPADRYELAMAHYGFIGYCLEHEQKQRARPYMDFVEVVVSRLVKDFPDDPRYVALRGALYGFRFI